MKMKLLLLPIRAPFSQVWSRVKHILSSPPLSNTLPSSPVIDLESQSSSDMQSSPSPEPAETHQVGQPNSISIVGIEIQLPITQQMPSPPQIKMVIAKQITPEWLNITIAFCFEAAIQIALQYEKADQHSKFHFSFYLLSFTILLTFFSVFVSQCFSKKFPVVSKMLEKVGIFLAAIAFFITIATPLTMSLINY